MFGDSFAHGQIPQNIFCPYIDFFVVVTVFWNINAAVNGACNRSVTQPLILKFSFCVHLFQFDLILRKCGKQKRPPLRKLSFRGRELQLRDTTPNLSAPHDTNLICCGQGMTCREHSAVTGAPVAALGEITFGARLQDHVRQLHSFTHSQPSGSL